MPKKKPRPRPKSMPIAPTDWVKRASTVMKQMHTTISAQAATIATLENQVAFLSKCTHWLWSENASSSFPPGCFECGAIFWKDHKPSCRIKSLVEYMEKHGACPPNP